MRVLFTTTGSPGHLLPLLPFAYACRHAGHDVRVATQRGRGAPVGRAGLQHAPFDGPPDAAWEALMGDLPTLTLDEANARVVGEIFGREDTRAALPGMFEILDRWRPALVVRETSELAGALAAERQGIPHARVALGLASVDDWTHAVMAPAIDEVRAEWGLRPDPGARRLRDAPLLTLSPHALEDPAMAGSAKTYRFRAVASPRSAAPLPDRWPNPRDPLVYVTFGSVAGSLAYFPALYWSAIAALASLPARVLLTIGQAADPAQLGPLPPTVHVERWVPQDDVLPHAAAIVGHGGYGTTLGALAHGVPQVVLPLFAADQWLNARRVAELGAGVMLAEPPGAERRALDLPAGSVLAALPDAIRRILTDPTHRREARSLAGAVAALPPVEAAVDVLEAIAAGATPGVGRPSARPRRRPTEIGHASRASAVTSPHATASANAT